MQYSPDILKSLHERGAHFVPCGRDKAAIAKGWQRQRANLDYVLQTAHKGNHIGIIPHSLGLVVIDLDRGDSDAFEEYLKSNEWPYVRSRSGTAGRAHFLFRVSSVGQLTKYDWRLYSFGGQVLVTRSYAVVYDLDKWVEALKLPVLRVGLTKVAPMIQKVQPAPEQSDYEWVEGQRNNKLFSEAIKILRQQALDSGLGEREVDATLRSAEQYVANQGYKVKVSEPVQEVQGSSGGGQLMYNALDYMRLEEKEAVLVDADGNVLLPSEGVTMVAGPTGHFKSFVMLDWAMQLATEGRRVLFFEAEGFQEFRRRVQASFIKREQDMAGFNNLIFADSKSIRKAGLSFGDHMEVILSQNSYWSEGHMPDVVFFDTFRTHADNEDENSNAEISRLIRSFGGYADSVVIIHHFRKDGETFAGAGAFSTNADSIIHIRRYSSMLEKQNKVPTDRDRQVVVVNFEQHRDYREPEPKAYRMTPYAKSVAPVEIDYASLKENSREDREEMDVEVITKAIRKLGGQATQRQLHEEIGKSQGWVSTRLDQGVRKGVIELIGKNGRAKMYGIAGDNGNVEIPF